MKTQKARSVIMSRFTRHRKATKPNAEGTMQRKLGHSLYISRFSIEKYGRGKCHSMKKDIGSKIRPYEGSKRYENTNSSRRREDMGLT